MPVSTVAKPDLEPALWSVRDLSRVLNRSEASLARDDAAARMPAALRLSGSKRYRASEILAWIDAGCPDRSTWENLRNAEARRS